MAKPTIELHAAHAWTCDACGLDNFVRAITFEPTESELPRLLDASGITREEYDDWLARPHCGGLFTSVPVEVACGHCGAEYDVADD